jgi:hypothetical protein
MTEIDSNAVSVLSAIKDGSVDGVKFCLNSGMFPNATDPDTDTKNSLHCMCGLAATLNREEVLRFLLNEFVFKYEKVEDILFKCAIAIFRAQSPEMNRVLLKSTLDFFKVTTLDIGSFSSRCMREFSQETALARNNDMLYLLWEHRAEFPIPEQWDEVEKKNIGKDKEFLPAVITGAVFYDDVELMEYGLGLPDKWQEYTNQCVSTWFRMAMEGHSPKVARILFPYVHDIIETNDEYASTVLKDSLRTGCYDLHLEINYVLLEKQKKEKAGKEKNTP